MYVRTYVCMYVSMYVSQSPYVCMYVCMYVCKAWLAGWLAGWLPDWRAGPTHVPGLCTPCPLCMYVCMYVCMYACMYGNALLHEAQSVAENLTLWTDGRDVQPPERIAGTDLETECRVQATLRQHLLLARRVAHNVMAASGRCRPAS